MQTEKTPITADLVLLGGGHSHLFVLKYLAMHPLPGVRLTLITRDLQTPYSGMLPGYIAGHYAYDEAHIDLQLLARHADARLIHAEVTAIEAELRQIRIEGRPAIAYDLLSINIGSRPSTPILQISDNQFTVKPVDHFIAAWKKLEQRLIEQDKPLKLAIVGGGAGGVELALALDYRAQQLPGQLEITLLTDRATLLPGHNPKVQQIFKSILAQRSILVHYEAAVDHFDGHQISVKSTRPVASDAVIWVTHASPAAWLRDSGLALDTCGFIEVNECLQSQSHVEVFAAGDIAAVASYPRPKSGVFAVRQGIPLARNLIRQLQGQALKAFKPQRQFLSLISTGDRDAVASRGNWAFSGKWCWWLKDRIDRRFIRRFSEFPGRERPSQGPQEADPMRCAGCGSKVGSAVLEAVLAQVCQEYAMQIAPGLEYPDDAATIEVPPGKRLIQSVDHFRAFIDDAYLFGRIAANHALSDLFAMGVPADSAMVIASVPFGSEEKQSQELYQLMSGVVATLKQHDTKLVGGHSSEASELACGLSVNGFAEPAKLMLKTGIQVGDLLILTKPLGSGVLFAADMRAEARGLWIENALANMLVSNYAASQCLLQYNASACTDVTGFGFAGHLFEMVRASACAVEILVDRLPLLPGAAELAKRGVLSSLQPQNMRICERIYDAQGLASDPHYPLLFDPQTAGGLLASLSPERAADCLAQLKELGYGEAQIVARAIPKTGADWSLSLLSS